MIRESDRQAMAELDAAGFLVDYYPERRDAFGVYLGSHGGSAPTLRKAMRRCLRCCKIGLWWKIGDRMAVDIAREVAVRHLGGWKELT